VGAENLVFAAASLAARSQDDGGYEDAYRQGRSGMRERSKQTSDPGIDCHG